MRGKQAPVVGAKKEGNVFTVPYDTRLNCEAYDEHLIEKRRGPYGDFQLVDIRDFLPEHLRNNKGQEVARYAKLMSAFGEFHQWVCSMRAQIKFMLNNNSTDYSGGDVNLVLMPHGGGWWVVLDDGGKYPLVDFVYLLTLTDGCIQTGVLKRHGLSKYIMRNGGNSRFILRCEVDQKPNVISGD